jgi:hypothetical protein
MGIAVRRMRQLQLGLAETKPAASIADASTQTDPELLQEPPLQDPSLRNMYGEVQEQGWLISRVLLQQQQMAVLHSLVEEQHQQRFLLQSYYWMQQLQQQQHQPDMWLSMALQSGGPMPVVQECFGMQLPDQYQ